MQSTVAYTPPTEEVAPPPFTPQSTTAVKEPSNPWISLPEAPAEPSAVLGTTQPATPGPVSASGVGRGRKAAPSWLLPVLIIPLISYSVVVTGLLAYCYMQLELERSADPLQQLGDDGFNPPASKNPKSALRGPISYKWETVYRALPAKLRTTLNQPLRVNQLEVTPRAVELRTVLIKQGDFNPEPGAAPSLVLFLELKNVSDDVEFCPLDPWFDRQYKPIAQQLNIPFTGLEMGESKRFQGGPAVNQYDPGAGRDVRETLTIDGIDEDLKPNKDHKLRQNVDRSLKPGEKMVSFVCTAPEHRVRDALKGYSGPLLYRVRLRNGLTTIRGRELSTTAVVGVEFTRDQIKEVAQTPR